MISRRLESDLKLKDYIKCYWYYNIRPETEKYFDIFPDGHFDLVVTIKDNQIVDTRLTGIWTKTVSISYSDNAEVFGVSFNPLAIDDLFKFSIKELLDDSRSISLDHFNIDEQVLIESLKQPKSLANYLNRQFSKLILNKEPDQRLKKCFELIDNSDGTISVNEISKIVGLSPRQLHKLVSNKIGIGIKEYSKIIRFKNSLLDIKQNNSNYFHYYDQSHFIREIKKYTGLTPREIDLKNNDRFIQYYYFG